MKYRVKITEEPRYNVKVNDLPEAKTGMQVNYSLYNKLAALGGADMKMSEPDRKATKTITKVPREAANLEAEGGETVLTFDPSGYPLFYTIKGPRHHSGGVPLNLPDDSFIFSDTKGMIIRECTILKMFNKPCNKKGYTPADLSKQFDINKYRNILQDPNTDEITRKTAESMIKKYVIKLGALALAQESQKGFPQGIPIVAKAYMEAYGISEDDILPQETPTPEMGMQQGQGQMSPTDQMPPDQYEQEGMPEGMQNAAPDQMMEQQMMAEQGQGQGQIPEGAATPDMVEPMMNEMEQQAPPMAMYGMAMGGFDFPYYPDQMAYGGVPMFPGGGITVNTNSSSAPITDSKRLGNEYNTGKYKPGQRQAGQTYYDVEGQPKIKGRGYTEGKDVEWSYSGSGGGNWNPTIDQAADQYCKNMKNPKSKLFYGVAAEVIAEKNFGYLKNSKDPAKQAQYAQILEKLKGCKAGGAQDKFEFVENEEPNTDCPPCTDPTTGQAITTGPDGKPFVRTKGPDGNCTPCPGTECYCEDENGNQVTVDCNDPCLKKKEEYHGEAAYDETPVQNLPEDELALWAGLGYVNPELRPDLLGNQGVQLEMYGIDPRSKANAAQAAANKIIESQGKFAANPGAGLANQLMAQAAAAPQVNAAFDEANKFNTQVRNQEIGINTEYRKDFLDKRPLFAQDYLGKLARYKENKARFVNEKLGRFIDNYRTMKGNARDIALINAGTENMKFDPISNKVYSRKTKDFTPTPGNADILAKTKQVMAEGIDDENVAYKIAQQMSMMGGPVYANGGFIYTNSVFPFIL